MQSFSIARPLPGPWNRRMPYVSPEGRDTVRRHARSDSLGSDPFDFLTQYTKAEFKGTAASTYLATRASRDKLREAFYAAVQTSNESIAWKGPAQSPVLLGVLSSDIRLALRSLRDFTQALGVPYVTPQYIGQDGTVDASVALPSVRGPVYVRFRALPDTEPQCTVTRYVDKDRGVLVNFGTLQVGHLPLGLLDEDKLNDEVGVARNTSATGPEGSVGARQTVD